MIKKTTCIALLVSVPMLSFAHGEPSGTPPANVGYGIGHIEQAQTLSDEVDPGDIQLAREHRANDTTDTLNSGERQQNRHDRRADIVDASATADALSDRQADHQDRQNIHDDREAKAQDLGNMSSDKTNLSNAKNDGDQLGFMAVKQDMADSRADLTDKNADQVASRQDEVGNHSSIQQDDAVRVVEAEKAANNPAPADDTEADGGDHAGGFLDRLFGGDES